MNLNSNSNTSRSLREIEEEVLEEGREWTRRRLEQRLQEEADRLGGVFPPQRKKSSPQTKGADGTAYGGRSSKTKGVARPGSTG